MKRNHRPSSIDPLPKVFGEPKGGPRLRVTVVTPEKGAKIADVWGATPEEVAAAMSRAARAYGGRHKIGRVRIRGSWEEPPPTKERAAIVFRLNVLPGVQAEGVAICRPPDVRAVLKEVQAQETWGAELARAQLLEPKPRRGKHHN